MASHIKTVAVRVDLKALRGIEQAKRALLATAESAIQIDNAPPSDRRRNHI